MTDPIGPYFIMAGELRFENLRVTSPVRLAARNLDLLRTDQSVLARQSPGLFRKRMREIVQFFPELAGRKFFTPSRTSRGKLRLYDVDKSIPLHDNLWKVPPRSVWPAYHLPIYVDYIRYIFYYRTRPAAETLAVRFVVMSIDHEVGMKYSVRGMNIRGFVYTKIHEPDDWHATFTRDFTFNGAFNDQPALHVDAKYATAIYNGAPLPDMHAHSVGHYTLITLNDHTNRAIMVPSTRLYRGTPSIYHFDAGVVTPSVLGFVLPKDDDGRFVVFMPNREMRLLDDTARICTLCKALTGKSLPRIVPPGVIEEE